MMNLIKIFLNKAGYWLSNLKVILIIFILLAITAGIQSYFGRLQPLVDGGLPYTQYNNYLIFKYAFYHLVELKDLYILTPTETGDLYKYSPTFALFFGPLAILPDLLGIILWNILNALVVFFAIKSLSGIDPKKRVYMLWFIAIELMTSLQNGQSNGLIAGLLIFAFIFLEKDKYALATLFIVITIYIKIYGIIAFVFFLIYKRKGKFFIYSVLWMFLFAVLPLVIIPVDQLKFLYLSWGKLLSEDHSISYGLSIMGWLYTWFNIEIDKNIVVLIGALLFMVPFINYKRYKDFNFRILILSSILIWIIIFNHKAESPSFIIAMCGMGIWFFTQENRLENKILLFLALLFTSFSTTDIFPSFIRNHYFNPYVVKVIPSIIIWFLVIYKLSFTKNKELANPSTNSNSPF